MSLKMKKLHKGLTQQLKDEDIIDAVHYFPNMSVENYHKLNKAYMSGKGCRISLKEHEMKGCGFVDNVKKSGKSFVKSGIADIAIDEAVNLLPAPAIAKKVIGTVAKKELHSLVGKGVNPFLPDELVGKGLNKQIKTYNDQSNLVHVHSDAFNPSIYNLPMYSNPIAKQLLKKGSGFKVMS